MRCGHIVLCVYIFIQIAHCQYVYSTYETGIGVLCTISPFLLLFSLKTKVLSVQTLKQTENNFWSVNIYIMRTTNR